MSHDQKVFESNRKLCCTVEAHRCIYDRTHPQYLKKEAYDEAWHSIARECEDTVASCKVRWRNIRTAFVRSVQGTPKKRTPNRTREYYLHEVLQFFIPHIINVVESEKGGPESDAEGTEKTPRNNEPEPEPESEQLKLKPEEPKPKTEQPKPQPEEPKPKSEESKPKPEEPKPEPEELKSEELKEETKNKSPTIIPVDDDEATTSADETAGEEPEAPLENSRLSPTKSKVKTFFIKEKPTKVGTFIIGKIPEIQNLNPLSLNTEPEVVTTPTTAVVIEPDLAKPQIGTKVAAETLELEDDERRFRFRRACKRGLDKTVMKALSKRENRKDPEMKRRRRSIVKTSITGAETVHEKSMHKVIRQQRHHEKRPQSQSKELLRAKPPQIIIPSDLVETQMKSSPVPETVSSDEWLKDFEVAEHRTMTPVSAEPTPNKDLVAITMLDQAVQCTPTSTAGDDDFLNSLKPQMSEMNARQKLIFKKKVFESLLEVFDSALDFPETGDVALTPNQTPAGATFAATTSDEMRLIRELVALVQASKETPNLNETNMVASPQTVELTEGNDLSDIVAELVMDTSSETAEPTMSLPTTTISPIARPTPNVSQSNIVATTTTAPKPTALPTFTMPTERKLNPANLPQHIIQRVVKIGDRGGGNLITQQGARRRIYRIYPRGSVPKSVQNGGPVSSGIVTGGAGTFIIPRAVPKATLPTLGRPPSNNKTALVPMAYSEVNVPPGSFIWPSTGAISSSQTSSSATTSSTGFDIFTPPTAGARRTMVTRSKIRVADGTEKHILRRYSICGAGPMSPSKMIAPSYGDAAVARYAAVGSSGGASHRVMGPGVAKQQAGGITNTIITTSTKTAPTAIVGTIDTSASLPIPGFNKFLSTLTSNSTIASPSAIRPGRSLFMATPTTTKSSKQTFEDSLAKSMAELDNIRKSIEASSSTASHKNRNSMSKRSAVEETAATIAPDNFAAYNVKDEPLDDSF